MTSLSRVVHLIDGLVGDLRLGIDAGLSNDAFLLLLDCGLVSNVTWLWRVTLTESTAWAAQG